MEDLRLTEEEIREHYPDEDIDTVFNILTRFDLQVGNWYRYADIKHFGDVFPKKHSDYATNVLRLEEYPPLYFQYVGGENPWLQATDYKVMHIDRYKYINYHEEDYAKYGLDWINGAEQEVNEIRCLVNRMLYKDVDYNNYKTIDYLKEIKDCIEYRLMCYNEAETLCIENMEQSTNRQKTHASLMLTPDGVLDGRDKTPCMYDFAEDILSGNEMIAICKRNHNDLREDSEDCKNCTENCCSWAGANKSNG